MNAAEGGHLAADLEPGLLQRLRNVVAGRRRRFDAAVVPTGDGLPNARVLTIFPTVLLVVLACLVAAGITGSSTGILNQFFSSTSDPDLLLGTPQALRSDEWMVQSTLVISQVEQGLPIYNETFPGGTDSTVQSDLPSTDWSMAFRPHLLGFLVLPLDNAAALRWWLPGFAMIAACFAFFVTMNPRRPVSAALVSVGFFFAPFFQWWYLPITFWPAVWCFVVMTCALWLLRSRRRAPRVFWLVSAMYTTVTMVIGVYVPFMVPALLVAFAFVVGAALSARWSTRGEGATQRIRAIVPLVAAGVGAALIVAAWVITRLETILRFLGTLYPGQRSTPPGTAGFRDAVSLFTAPWTRGLGADTRPLAGNASESSTFVMIGLFLLVPLAYVAWRDLRARRHTDWIIVGMIVVTVVVFAYYFLPGWDGLARLLLLDRTTPGRMRFALGLVGVVAIALLVSRLDDRRGYDRASRSRIPAAATTGIALAVLAATAWALCALDSDLVQNNRAWIVLAGGAVLSTYFYSTRRALVASAGFFAVSVLGSAVVNPVYVGVYDLNHTALVKEMKSLEDAAQADWVGVGNSVLPTVALVQSGLHSYNGFQSAPSPEMWHQIDPRGTYELAWNRLANIHWTAGEGEPTPTNPYPDVISLNFDSCAGFAQRYVEYVLSDAELDQGCLTVVDSVQEGPSTFWIYEVSSR